MKERKGPMWSWDGGHMRPIANRIVSMKEDTKRLQRGNSGKEVQGRIMKESKFLHPQKFGIEISVHESQNLEVKFRAIPLLKKGHWAY